MAPMTPRTHADVPPNSTDVSDSSPESPASGSSHPGDLARRIAHRRRELGLTTEEWRGGPASIRSISSTSSRVPTPA